MRLKKKRPTKKIKYKFLAYQKNFNNIEHIGTTDDPCRTTISCWRVYNNYKNKSIGFDIDFSAKRFIFDYSLQLLEENGVKTYKLSNKTIERREFIILLGCET